MSAPDFTGGFPRAQWKTSRSTNVLHEEFRRRVKKQGSLPRGTVEFGVSSALLTELAGSPLARPTSAFMDLARRRGVTWLEPRVSVEVSYAGARSRPPTLPVLRGALPTKRA